MDKGVFHRVPPAAGSHPAHSRFLRRNVDIDFNAEKERRKKYRGGLLEEWTKLAKFYYGGEIPKLTLWQKIKRKLKSWF